MTPAQDLSTVSIFLPGPGMCSSGRRSETLAQLVDIAGRLEQFDGMEAGMADIIRQALAHASLTDAQASGEVLLGPWCA